MSRKKITIEAASVEDAIALGLEKIGLKQELTYIEIVQEESIGFLSKKKAIVSIAFEEEDAVKALEQVWLVKLQQTTQIIYEEQAALAKVEKEFLEHKAFTTDKKADLLKEALIQMGFKDVDSSLIKDLCNDTGSYQFYQKIKEFETIPLNDEGASIFLMPSENMMSCHAILFYPKKQKGVVTFENVVDALKKSGIIKGIYKHSIENAISSMTTTPFEIAKGKSALAESVSKLELFFQEDERKEFQEMMEYLKIDTRDVKDLNICERNQLLVRVHHGKASAAGYQIDGKTIMGDGATSTDINLGSNVYWSEDKSEIFSNQAGHIKWDIKNKVLDVEPIYVVEGNIDFSEGNLEGFSGKVIIKGDVMPKFKVSVEGDIEIHGTVEDAIVESTRGSVTIMGSVINHNEGYIQAKKDVHVSIAQNAKIHANNIYIQKESMNCELKASNGVFVEGNPGVIVGGNIFADNIIRANIIGSANWVKTKVHAGDIREDLKNLKRLKREVQLTETEIDNYNGSIEILNGIKKQKSLSDEQEEELKKLQEKTCDSNGTNLAYKKDIEELNKRIESLKKARIEVVSRIYPQVDLCIYNGFLVPSEEEVFTAFICRDGRIDKRPL